MNDDDEENIHKPHAGGVRGDGEEEEGVEWGDRGRGEREGVRN
jgi:hypothetical protein